MGAGTGQGWGRPPGFVEARLVRESGTLQVFDLRECQDNGVCVSIREVLMEAGHSAASDTSASVVSMSDAMDAAF